jgi:hypothetical protein
MFEDKEAVVTRCEVKVGQRPDTTNVRKIRRKAPQLKWNAAPAARNRKPEDNQGKENRLATPNKVQPPPAMSAPAYIPGYDRPRTEPTITPPGSGGTLGQHQQVPAPLASDNPAGNKQDETPRNLDDAVRTTTSPLDARAAGTTGTHAIEAPTPNKVGQVAAAADSRPQLAGEMTVPCVTKVPAPRKDSERFIPGPNDAWIVREWASTPHDMEANWIHFVLDRRMTPTHISPERWVMETIDRATRDFVAHREENESERALALSLIHI